MQLSIHQLVSWKRYKISYIVHDIIPKEVIYFEAKLEGKEEIKIQEEEIEKAFWLNVEEVRNILTFENLKELWDEVYEEHKEEKNGKINI